MCDSKLTKAIEEELLCHLCYDLLKDPRDLECPHVFCLQCIKKLIGNSVTIECPECRHVTFVPIDGMNSLKPNLRLRNMIDKITYYRKDADVDNDMMLPRCPFHEDERLNFKCTQCDVLICQYCLVRSHRGHDVVECATNGILLNRPAINKYQTEIRNLKDTICILSNSKSTLIRKVKSEETKINQHVQMLTVDLHTKARNLKVVLNSMKDRKLERLNEKENEIKERINELEIQCVATKMCNNKISKQEIEHMKYSDAFCSDYSAKPLSDGSTHDSSDIQFQTSRNPKTSLLQIGRLVYKRKLTLVSEFGIGTFQKAQGIAVTSNGLLAVADSRSNHVDVFCIEDYRYKRSFQLGAVDVENPEGNITRPLDVGVTSEGKFLVIDSSMVKIYSNGGKFEQAFRTGLQDTEDVSAPQGIATTLHNGDDVVVVADLGRQIISVHRMSGTLIRILKVDIDPRNRIATDGTHIVFTNYQEGKVCVIDFQSGDKILTLNIPKVTAICLDEKKSGCMFIGRNDGSHGSGVIEQYCLTTGKLVTRLACGLYAALGMTLSDDDNQLIVADMISVKVYSIKDC